MTPSRTGTPRVSVVSGYYNRAAFAAASIASILDQTFTDFEYLVFDDASSDGTVAVLESFADPRLQVIRHLTNLGFVRGMIAAIARARGEYIAVHGSGDLSHRQRLERQVAFLDRHPEYGAVGSHRRNVAPDGSVLSIVRPRPADLRFERLLRANVYSHGEVTYRRALYEDVGGYRPQFTYAQDRDLWLRMARESRLGVVPEVLYDRIVQADGVSFVPAKLARQAMFSHLAATLARLEPSQQRDLLARVDAGGIESVVSPDHPVLRRRFARKVIVLGVAGRWTDAQELADLLPRRGGGSRAFHWALRAFASLGRRLDPDGARARRAARLLGRRAGDRAL